MTAERGLPHKEEDTSGGGRDRSCGGRSDVGLIGHAEKLTIDDLQAMCKRIESAQQ